MKKNGFTLVELLAVVTIIAITIVIVVVRVEKNVKDVNKFSNDEKIKLIENASLIYMQEYINELSNIENKKVDVISLQTLVNKGLIKETSLENENLNNIVIVANINNNYKTKYIKTPKPAIFINGSDEITLHKNEEYTELGAYVAIISEGITNSNITINSTVNTNSIGNYEVRYLYNNADTVIRKVKVIN